MPSSIKEFWQFTGKGQLFIERAVLGETELARKILPTEEKDQYLAFGWGIFSL